MKKYEQSIGEVLKNMVNDSGKMKQKLFQTKISTAWGRLMGTTIAAYTTEIKLRDNTLFLSISSAPLRQELAYAKDKIIDVLNAELGEEYLQEVVLR